MSALRVGRPGEPIRLIYDMEPTLTKRQEEVLHLCRSFGGNRHRTARHLGVSFAAVQQVLRNAAKAGANLPPSLPRQRGVPNMVTRQIEPRCGRPLRRGPCSLIKDHPHHCRVSR